MSIYSVDASCYIESQYPRKGENLAHNGAGVYLGDEHLIRNFFKIEKAIKKGDHAGLEERVKKLDDINAVCNYVGNTSPSYTLLHKAVDKGCEVCTRVLLESGAHSNIENSNGETAERVARIKNNPQIITLIEKNNALSKAISERTVECTLDRKVCRKIGGGLGFPDIWMENFEGTLAFGPNFGDTAKVMLSRSAEAATNNYELKVLFTVVELEYDGKKAFKIKYDESICSMLVLTPNLGKYLMGKNNLFVSKEETQAREDSCIIN